MIVNALKAKNGRPTLMGHRGGFRPQNSLESFAKAVQNKNVVKSIELDVS